MLTAPELVIAERIELLDEVEVTAELQHRVLADRVVRGKESSEFEASHSDSSGPFFLGFWIFKLWAGADQGNRDIMHAAMHRLAGQNQPF
jgi:hypothetical protein